MESKAKVILDWAKEHNVEVVNLPLAREGSFIVDLRWTNPGPAKYLMDSWNFNSFMDAYRFAKDLASKTTDEYFVEIRQA